MSIPFNSLKAQIAPIEDDLRAAFERVLERGWFLMGPEADAFEKEFAAAMHCDFCVSMNSGTDALILALSALGCAGGEVVLPAHTALPCYHAVLAAGCTPVFAEVDEATYCIDPASAARMIGPKTKALIAVHLYGHPCDMGALTALCSERGVALIEDCAQAHGATVDGRVAGSMGDLSAFSFYPTKNLGALGDAGAVCGPAGEAAGKMEERLRLVKQYGEASRYASVTPGVNSRMDEMQAAFLRTRLPRLAEDTEARRTIAKIYDEGLDGLPVVTPAVAEGCGHVYHLYVIRSRRRDELMAFLKERGIGTAIHYPAPGHGQPLFAKGLAPCRTDDMSLSDRLAGEILSLPMFPGLKSEEAEEICAAVRAFYEG